MKPLKPLLIFILVLVTAQCVWAQIVIMPLGDSITRGIPGSTDETGYRRYLRDLLVSSGYQVDFVGSLRDGTFADNQHEGHSGFTVSDMNANIDTYLAASPAPQIILLHIGTNSISQDVGYIFAGEVGTLLDRIDARDEGIIVILARIINRNTYSGQTTTFNTNVNAMAASRIISGDRLVVVDMEEDAGIDYKLTSAGGDMFDNLHPFDTGYEKMADKWFVDGLLKVLPHADAGNDQSVNEKTPVTLDGSGSFDPDGVSLGFLWEQVPQVPTGTSVTLSDRTDENPTFTAPSVGLSGERLEFKLTVTDADGFQHSDTVLVDINDVLLPPVADAGGNQTVTPGSTVMLNGSNSYDPDGTITSVQWEQVSGATQVSLSNPTGLMTSFTAPEAEGEVLAFKLTLKDDNNQVSEDSANVTIATSTSNDSGGGGGCFIQTVTN